MSPGVRPAAVAGQFYAAEPERLDRQLDAAFAAAREVEGSRPRAIIAPHAGYQYSGPIAATAYRLATRDGGGAAERVELVVVAGPAHRWPVRGVAVSSADAFRTPLGELRVDTRLRDRLLELPAVAINDDAHAGEHSLEVHLPFIQRVFGDVAVLPLLVGVSDADDVADVLELAGEGEATITVISTDLSHYLDYETAVAVDRRTAEAIERRRPEEIADRAACGAYPLRGLLVSARRRRQAVRTLDLRNSGDTAGPRDQVVGYGAFAVG